MGKTNAARELLELARAHDAKNETDQAFACLEQALDLDEHSPAALALMGEQYYKRNELLQAIGHYMLAIDEDVTIRAHKKRFMELAGRIPLNQYNAAIAGTLLACLETPHLDCMPAQLLWVSTLAVNPGFDAVFNPETCKTVGAPMPPGFLQRKPEWKALLAPLFLAGLKKIVIYDVVFEVFLTHLRRRLLEGLAEDQPSRDDRIAIAAALAHYCFETEYIFDVTAAEAVKFADLKEKLETAGAEKDRHGVAVYACYAPLHSLKTAKKIEETQKKSAIAELVRLQLTSHRDLLKARDAVEAVTAIDDAVSVKVRAQYEESPYPRWRGYREGLYDPEVEGTLGPAPAILSAGCGTGMEAVQLAAALPQGSVLGVDLSRMSLAYAGLKAKEHGISNVEFRQGDILRLPETGKTFDYIAAAGVLHHMADPAAGGRALAGMLKQGGLLRLGLYSKTAHRGLMEAQKAIAAGGFTPTPESMRDFRRRGPDLLPPEVLQDVMSHGDYFHLSMYRDLLFHAQDHRFDIPDIAQLLDKLGLEFRRFLLLPQVTAQYRQEFPADAAMTSLENWHHFEQKYPAVFRGMYQFWCRKKST